MQQKSSERGAIARILVEEGVVAEDRLRYAERIRKKLDDPRPILEILKELGALDEKRARQALHARRAEIPLGELLVEQGHLRPEELARALEVQQGKPEPRPRLGEVLVELRLIPDRKLAQGLAFQLGLPLMEPDLGELDAALLGSVPKEWLERHQFVPVKKQGDKVVVAFGDPSDAERLAAAETVFGNGRVQPAIASLGWIQSTLENLGSAGRAGAQAAEQAAAQLVEAMIRDALQRDASDIHIEPTPDRLRVRFREDGVLVLYREFPRHTVAPVASRLKVLCGADIAEKRRHQGGRLMFEAGGHKLDLRASFYVTIHGEKIVLRLLNPDRRLLGLDEIGMAPRMIERFVDDALGRPSGVILITGPTGSGKTSTLYSCVHQINRPETSIITAEDPVEYVMEGVGQCSLNPAIDLTFEETLRHIVRQDPDVIVIGEIRDTFSAETAIQAALTGHKVLTTFHTEDTIGGLVRLLNMDIEAFLVSSTVVSVLAQRLVRRVCDGCAAPHEPTQSELRRLGYTEKDLEIATLRRGRGCEECRYTGYRGRVAVFELLVLDEHVRDAVLTRQTAYEIRRISRESSGLVSLLEDGIVKACKGVTTLEEALRMLPRLDPPRPLRELRRQLGERT